MAWTIAPIAGTPSYTCLGNTILRHKLNELDSAEITCEGTFTPDTVVQVKEGATILFQGYVKESNMEQNGKLYKLTLIETAQDLKYNIVSYLGSRSFIQTGKVVYELVDIILGGSGWVRGTSESTPVTALGFYNTNSSAALVKLLKDMLGNRIWFTATPDGVTKQVWWGAYRVDRTGAPITTWISKQQEADSIDRNITKITVFGENSTIYASAGSGTKEKVYKYSLAKTITECTDIATKLLADMGSNKTRYVLTLPKTNTYYIADKVRVSGVDYIVFDVTKTQSNTVIGIGAGEVSYAETLGSNLEEISGAIKSPSQKTYDGGEQSCNSVTAWSQNITIPDVNNVTDFKLKVRAKKFKSLTAVSAQTAYLSDISQISNSSTAPSGSIFGYSFQYYPSTSGLALSSMANGHQFGMATVSGDVRNLEATGNNFYLQMEYKVGSGGWTAIGSQLSILIAPMSSTAISLSTLFPGQADGTQLYLRFYVWSTDSSNVSTPSGITLRGQRVTRHYHSVTATQDINEQSYGITSMSVYCRGVLVQTISSPVEDLDYEVNITSYLANGDNLVTVMPNYKGNIVVTGSYYSV